MGRYFIPIFRQGTTRPSHFLSALSHSAGSMGRRKTIDPPASWAGGRILFPRHTLGEAEMMPGHWVVWTPEVTQAAGLPREDFS